MNTAIINNSVEEELNKVILWQYDNASNLCALIGTSESDGAKTRGLLPQFFFDSTESFWNAIAKRFNISNPEDADDFSLSIWSRIIGIGRPSIIIDDGRVAISTELFRRIVIGRIRLLQSNASLDAYQRFVEYVFDGNVTAIDNQDMSISFAWTGGEPTEDIDIEAKALFDQNKDSVIAYPSGIKSSEQSIGPVFGFAEQVRTDGDDNQIVSTSIILSIANNGDEAKTIPSTTSFTHNGKTYTIESQVVIQPGEVVDVRFVADGEDYIIPFTIDDIGLSDDEVVIFNSSRSNTDFMIETFNNCSFAWNRKFN